MPPGPVIGLGAVQYVDVVFDGTPGPEAPRFIEVEDPDRRSIRVGEWVERDDGAGAAHPARPLTRLRRRMVDGHPAERAEFGASVALGKPCLVCRVSLFCDQARLDRRTWTPRSRAGGRHGER
jgi:hypothetical protein